VKKYTSIIFLMVMPESLEYNIYLYNIPHHNAQPFRHIILVLLKEVHQKIFKVCVFIFVCIFVCNLSKHRDKQNTRMKYGTSYTRTIHVICHQDVNPYLKLGGPKYVTSTPLHPI
jgi:hypothetical protein